MALNSRLAPDVYLGVLDVTDADGVVQDHLVAMRRMPDDRRLARCVARGEDLERPLRAIAHAVAALHELAPPTPSTTGWPRPRRCGAGGRRTSTSSTTCP